RQRDQLVRIGVDLDRRVVGAEHHRVLGEKKLRGLDADTGIAAPVAGIVLAPQLAPAGPDENGIARLERDVLFLHRAVDVLRRDLVAVAQYLDALQAGDVEQHAARDQRADVLDAELGEAVAGLDVAGLDAVVVAAVVALVREAVELGADL